MPKQKYYVVWKGKEPGIYLRWSECEKQIKGFEGALYKSFEVKEQAEKAYESNPWQFIGKKVVKQITPEQRAKFGSPVSDSLSVDAACSGNPGVLEYRGVDTQSGIQLFRRGPFPEGTINIGEFLAIVHGLAYLAQRQSNFPVYSDSRTAIKWVKDKAIKTKLERSPKNEKLFELVDRAIVWLQNNRYSNPVLKWETEAWGENPADFGRK